MESEGCYGDERLFNPDYYRPDEKLFDSEGEEETTDTEGAMKFWDTFRKATILRELVANSVKSLEQITPKAGLEESDEHLIIGIVINKNKKTLTIIDNGVGMTKDELECYGSSSGGGRGRGLLLVANKVVITTKHEDDGEYAMELSPFVVEKIVGSTQEEEEKEKEEDKEDLLVLFSLGGRSRGTKTTLFFQKDEVEYLEVPTYTVLVERFFSTNRINIITIEADVITEKAFSPNSNAWFETLHHVSSASEPAS